MEPRASSSRCSLLRGEDDEPVDVVGKRPCRLDLFLRMFAGVGKQYLQIGHAGLALHGPNHGGEVRVGDVRDDHRDVACATRLHHPRRAIGHKSELFDGTLYPLARGGSDLLGTTQGRDTVAGCTSARAATSRIVTRLGVPTVPDVTRLISSSDHDSGDRNAGAALRPDARLGTDGGEADLRPNAAGEHRAPGARSLRTGPSGRLRR